MRLIESHLDWSKGQFFEMMQMVMFFMGLHCFQRSVNGFDTPKPLQSNVFYKLTIGNAGFSMVFKKSCTKVCDGTHCKRLKSTPNGTFPETLNIQNLRKTLRPIPH